MVEGTLEDAVVACGMLDAEDGLDVAWGAEITAGDALGAEGRDWLPEVFVG